MLWKWETWFDDCHKLVYRLKPLNAYARSKNNFDKWVLDQSLYPPFWAGVRFLMFTVLTSIIKEEWLQ